MKKNKVSSPHRLLFAIALGALALACVLFAPSAVRADSSWTTATVNSGTSYYVSLAFDRSGYPVISYYDPATEDLKYASYNGSNWTHETIDSAGNVGGFSSLAVNTSGYPAIGYYDFTNGDLKCASYDGSAWSIMTVDSTNDVGWSLSLAFDGSDHPAISYYDNTNQDLKYASYNGSAWSITTVDSAGDMGDYSSLAFDSSGRPAIGYYDLDNQDLKYASYNGSSWSISTVESSGIVGLYPSLAFDNSGNPAISHYDSGNQDLKYTSYNGSAWSTTTVDSAGAVGYSTSLAFDSSGHPAISYLDGGQLKLKFGANNGSAWQTSTLGGIYAGGPAQTSLKFEGSLNPMIAYSAPALALNVAYYGEAVTEASVTINSGDVATNDRTVTLQIEADGTPGYVKIGESSDLSSVLARPYESEMEYTLSENNGEKTVYIEVLNYLGKATASDSIKYAALGSKIIATTGPGEISKLQVYDAHGNKVGKTISGLFPANYLGGAGVVAIDADNTGIKEDIAVYALTSAGPQVRIMGPKSNGSLAILGQMFVFDQNSRSGLSVTAGDFDNDGYQDDLAACQTGNNAPIVRIYKNVKGINNWKKIGEFKAPFGNVGCNLGTFEYDDKADEILVTPHHGPAAPEVSIYTVGGTLKKKFLAFGAGVTNGVTASGIGTRIYATANNGSSQVVVYDKNGKMKNTWFVYSKSVKGNFQNVPGDVDNDGVDEILISPVGANGPQIRSYESSGKLRSFPNFFAFDKNKRNGVSIAVIDNWHGAR